MKKMINIYEKINKKAINKWIKLANQEMEESSSPDDFSHKNISYTKEILKKYAEGKK